MRGEPALDVQEGHLRDGEHPGHLQQSLRSSSRQRHERPDGDEAEYQARNAADLQWLQDTFDEAAAKNSAAVMIIGQADPGFDATDADASADA